MKNGILLVAIGVLSLSTQAYEGFDVDYSGTITLKQFSRGAAQETPILGKLARLSIRQVYFPGEETPKYIAVLAVSKNGGGYSPTMSWRFNKVVIDDDTGEIFLFAENGDRYPGQGPGYYYLRGRFDSKGRLTGTFTSNLIGPDGRLVEGTLDMQEENQQVDASDLVS